MLQNAEKILDGFYTAIAAASISDKTVHITHKICLPLHENCVLPKGKCAVYVFSLTHDYGSKCPAGAHRVIKVGKVGPNSNPRFQYQHYNPKSAQSTLGGRLITYPVLWPYLGISSLKEGQVEGWLKSNTDRDHFFLDGDQLLMRDALEVYLKGLLGPVFEG